MNRSEYLFIHSLLLLIIEVYLFVCVNKNVVTSYADPRRFRSFHRNRSCRNDLGCIFWDYSGLRIDGMVGLRILLGLIPFSE